jgi:hypothetical protein
MQSDSPGAEMSAARPVWCSLVELRLQVVVAVAARHVERVAGLLGGLVHVLERERGVFAQRVIVH